MKRMSMVLAAALVAALVLGAVAAAQPVGPSGATSASPPKLGEGKGQVVLTWDEFVRITGYDPARKGGQMLTIPWVQVEELLGVKVDQAAVKSATVDLPWTEFKALLEWSVNKKGAETPPPTDFVVSSSEYTGTLSDEKAEFKLVMKIDVLREKGWKRIPLLPANVALGETVLPVGAYINSSNNVYELITEKSGKMEVTLNFAVAVEKASGINQVGFQRVTPGSSLLDLTVERENVDVKVGNSQKTVTTPVKTEVKVDGKAETRNETHVVAAIPMGAPVAISWERALPKVEKAPTKLYAETRTLVAVAEGALVCDEVVNFNILHSAIRELKLQVPAGCSVLAVTGANLQDWRVDKSDLMVQLRNEVIGSYSLRVTYEALAKETVAVPVVRTVGAEREKGYIAVIAVTNVEIDAGEVSGATAFDVRQLPSDIVAMTNQPILLAFRYVEEKFSIQLTIKKHEEVGVLVTLVDSGLFTAMQLEDGRRITKVVYNVRNNRNQFLRLQMPKGAEIWSAGVGGNTVAPAKDEKGDLLIPLVRSTTSAAELASFPVEIVYVETPAQTATTEGKLHVTLPTCTSGVPVMQVMYSYYLPADGKYTVGWGKSGFSGPMQLVDKFSEISTGPGVAVVKANVAAQVEQMQQQVDVQVDTQARRAGATPIRVRLPINGKLFMLERILVLPGDQLWFDVEYSGWKPAK